MTIQRSFQVETPCGSKFKQRLPVLCAGWAVAAFLVVAGCAPAFNWRLVQHDGVPATALMPCKPDRATREVAMLGPQGPTATLHLMSCEVDALTFAWAAWPVDSRAQGQEAIAAWQRAGWASLGQTVPAGQAAPDGWKPMAVTNPRVVSTQQWTGPAVNHQGHAIEAHWLMVQQQGWVMQLAMYGPPADAEVVKTFMGELQWP